MHAEEECLCLEDITLASLVRPCGSVPVARSRQFDAIDVIDFVSGGGPPLLKTREAHLFPPTVLPGPYIAPRQKRSDALLLAVERLAGLEGYAKVRGKKARNWSYPRTKASENGRSET